MIRLFTNYSYAGYYELYLGKISDMEEFRYYLPLLAVEEEKLKSNPNDEELKNEVARLNSYPAILRHGTNDEATLPSGWFTLVSKPGFKSIYRRLGSHYLFVVSDIVGGDHDEMGGGQRQNPFTMLFVGEYEDCSLLNSLAFEMIQNEIQVRKVLGGLFSYDADANGLRFSLGEIIKFFESFKNRKIEGFNLKTDAPLIVLSPGFSIENTLALQELKGKTIGCVYDADGRLISGKPISSLSALEVDPGDIQEPLSMEQESEEEPENNGEESHDGNGIIKSGVRKIKNIYRSMTPEAQKFFWSAVLISFLIGAVATSISKCSHNSKEDKNSSISQTL